MTSSSFLPESSRACDLTSVFDVGVLYLWPRISQPTAYSTIAETFDWAFGGEPPMRSLIRSNAHPQIYRLIYSKVAELLFILRSH
jgi:hypothetical protein